MRRILLLAGLVFHFVTLFSQRQDTTVYSFHQIVAVGNDNMVAVLANDKEQPTKLYLKYIDTLDQVIAEKFINLNRLGIRGQLEAIFHWNGKLSILSSLYYPGPQRNHLIFKQYELPSLEETASKEIDEAYTPGLYRIPFGYSLSPDSTKILFYSWSYAIPDDPARLSLHVLDQQLGLIWQNYNLLPFNNETLYIYGCQVDNQGKAYILCENYEGKVSRNMTVRPNKIKYFALMMEPNVNELRVYPLEIEDRTIEGLRFTMEDNNDLHAAGFFREKNKRTFSGVFLFRVDGESKKLTRKLLPISKELYDDAYAPTGDEPTFNPQKRGFSGYVADRLELADDGSIFLVAEQRPDLQGRTPAYEYNDLLAFKISPRRTLDWMVRVPKRQRGFYGTLSIFSYAMFEEDGRLFLLFNDQVGNDDSWQKGRTLDVYQGGKTANMLVRILEDGSWKSHDISALIDSKAQMTVYPSYCWSLGDRLLIYGEQIENDQLKGYFVTLDWELLGR